MIRSMEKKNEMVICEQCGKELFRRNLQRHLNRAHNYRDLVKCDLCSRVMYKESIENHLDVCKKKKEKKKMMEKYKLNDKSSVKVHNHTVIQFSMIPSIMKTDPPIRNSPILNMSSSPETSHLPENDKLKNLPCKKAADDTRCLPIMSQLQHINSRRDFDKTVHAAFMYLQPKKSCNLRKKSTSDSKLDKEEFGKHSSGDNSCLDNDSENDVDKILGKQSLKPDIVFMRECTDELYSGLQLPEEKAESPLNSNIIETSVKTKTMHSSKYVSQRITFLEGSKPNMKTPKKSTTLNSKSTDEIGSPCNSDPGWVDIEHEFDHNLDEHIRKIDAELEAAKVEEVEYQKYLQENEGFRDRLEAEVTEPVIRELFNKRLEFFKEIWSGRGNCARHDQYARAGADRQALRFSMIYDPYTEQQLDWVIDEISKVWMRTDQEKRDNNDYVWKVLLPEALIKIYMDHFSMERLEVEKRILNTPLRKEDDF